FGTGRGAVGKIFKLEIEHRKLDRRWRSCLRWKRRQPCRTEQRGRRGFAPRVDPTSDGFFGLVLNHGTSRLTGLGRLKRTGGLRGRLAPQRLERRYSACRIAQYSSRSMTPRFA